MTIEISLTDKYGQTRTFNRQDTTSQAFCISALTLNRIYDQEIQVTQISRVTYYPGTNHMHVYCRGEIQHNDPRPTHA